MTRSRQRGHRPAKREATARPAPRRPRHDGRDLLEKYRALCVKYEAAVGRARDAAVARASDVGLALHAVRASATAYAMIRAGVLAGRNRSFNDLARRMGWAAPGGGERFGTLEELVVAKAAALRGHGAQLAGRWEPEGGPETFELRLERIDARPPLVVATVQDISDQVRAERDLATARQAMFDQERLRTVGELASGIAHDLNNVLHALALRLERLRASPALAAAEGANLDALARIVSDAAARIARVQDLARTRASEPSGAVDLASVVGEAIAIVRPDLESDRRPGARPVVVEQATGELPPVVGDAPELRHLFLNLLVNARDAMPRGGRVRVEAERRGSAVVVRVADEGHGIAPGDLGRIFDPFFTTKGERGTGLGLSIAAGVMRRLGGSISAGNGPGGGAVFTLTFPVATGALAARARAGVRSAPAARTRREVPAAVRTVEVLVVDDDRENLEATQLFLEGRCGRVSVASSGAEAIAALERGARWDLALCDIGMPGMSGWDAVRRMRELAPEMPIYMLSGWAQEIARDDPRRALAAGVLAKPVDVDALDALLAEVAARRTPRAPSPAPEAPPPPA